MAPIEREDQLNTQRGGIWWGNGISQLLLPIGSAALFLLQECTRCMIVKLEIRAQLFHRTDQSFGSLPCETPHYFFIFAKRFHRGQLDRRSVHHRNTEINRQDSQGESFWRRILFCTLRHDWKMFEFLTDECVSDHNERIRSIQIDRCSLPSYWWWSCTFETSG